MAALKTQQEGVREPINSRAQNFYCSTNIFFDSIESEYISSCAHYSQHNEQIFPLKYYHLKIRLK